MDKIKLEDIISDRPEFTLSKTKKVYRLRPPHLDDQIWMAKRFGTAHAMAQMITNRDWPTICEFVYHQMSMKGRGDFKFGRVRIIDDSGKTIVKEMTGPEKLLVQLTSEDGVGILKAINRAIADSNPIVEKAMLDETKKKIREMNLSLSLPAGAKSST